jgi:hypothetical protein
LAEAGFDLGFAMEKLLELELNATLDSCVDPSILNGRTTPTVRIGLGLVVDDLGPMTRHFQRWSERIICFA